MRQTIEINAEALAVCASVLGGFSRGILDTDDCRAIWETFPEETRDYFLEMLAATREERL